MAACFCSHLCPRCLVELEKLIDEIQTEAENLERDKPLRVANKPLFSPHPPLPAA